MRRLKAKAKPADPELEAGSRAHYDDPAHYAATYGSRIEDVAFYVDLALKYGGPVLEYGVGNGRIALPIARHGISVTGIDRSEPMLDDLRARLRDEPPEIRTRVALTRGDMRTAQIGKRFPLVICPFNAALHLYERADVEAFLARVRAHLAPGGRFVVDLSTPRPEDLARDPARAYRAPRFRHAGAGVVVRYHEHFDYDPIRQVLFVSMHFTPKEGEPWMTPLAHRQFFPREWEALLHYNGFEVEAAVGDFGADPPDASSDSIAWIARAKKR